AADQPLLGLEMRDALRAQPVDQTFYFGHHFRADAVTREKQQFMGRHGVSSCQFARSAKTPLRGWQDTIDAAALCKPARLCHNASPPECLICQSPNARSLTRIPRG